MEASGGTVKRVYQFICRSVSMDTHLLMMNGKHLLLHLVCLFTRFDSKKENQ